MHTFWTTFYTYFSPMIDQKRRGFCLDARCSWLQGAGCGLKKVEMRSMKLAWRQSRFEIHPSSPIWCKPGPSRAPRTNCPADKGLTRASDGRGFSVQLVRGWIFKHRPWGLEKSWFRGDKMEDFAWIEGICFGINKDRKVWDFDFLMYGLSPSQRSWADIEN